MNNLWLKIISSLQLVIIFTSSAFAYEVNVKKALDNSFEHPLDIGQIYMVPQFEKNQDPSKKSVSIEIFYGEIDDTPASEKRLEWLKETLNEQKRINPKFKSEIIALGKYQSNIRHSQSADDFINRFKLNDSKVKYEELPKSLDLDRYTYDERKDDKDRQPSSVINSRSVWTLVKVAATAGGVASSLYFSEQINPAVAFGVAMVPALVSGAITYFSAQYGNFITNKSWSRWFLESDNFFTKNLRNRLGITPNKFDDMLAKNKKELLRTFPKLKDSPEIFEKMAIDLTGDALEKGMHRKVGILAKMAKGEEYLKWFLTELSFTTFGLKVPQAIAGIGATASLAGAAGDILTGSAMGVIAQGPADIAIQQRKLQKIHELRDAVKNGTRQVANRAELLSEIEKVLATEGRYASYVIHDGSHVALKSLETWARSRLTMLSFFSVVGVGMEVAGIPLAKPWLISVSVAGGLYYANVNGIIKTPKTLTRFGQRVNRLIESGRYELLPYVATVCSNKFLPRKK